MYVAPAATFWPWNMFVCIMYLSKCTAVIYLNRTFDLWNGDEAYLL